MSAEVTPTAQGMAPEPAFPPRVMSGPQEPRWAHTLPKWQLSDFVPELTLISWPALVECRELHREAQAEYENLSGKFERGEVEKGEAVAALRQLREISEEVVATLQATDAAKPALESYAEHRERLTPPAAGRPPSHGYVKDENRAAQAQNERLAVFYERHRAEREALKADHHVLVHVLGPAFRVSVDDSTALLLADPEPEPTPGRDPGEPAPPLEEQRAA